MDDGYLHSDSLLVKHLLARMTPEQRAPLLAAQPEVQALQKARDMLWLRIGMCGNEGSEGDLLDIYRDGDS
jgi:hypothetical protein